MVLLDDEMVLLAGGEDEKSLTEAPTINVAPRRQADKAEPELVLRLLWTHPPTHIPTRLSSLRTRTIAIPCPPHLLHGYRPCRRRMSPITAVSLESREWLDVFIKSPKNGTSCECRRASIASASPSSQVWSVLAHICRSLLRPSLADPSLICRSHAASHVHVPPTDIRFGWYIGTIVVLVLLGGVFSGLTLGLMGLDSVSRADH